MSYIYEALKRAEDENARGVVAPRIVRRPAFFAASPRWWLWALIGVLGVNAAVLVTLVLVRGSRPPDLTMATTGTVVSTPPDAPHETPLAPTVVAPAPPPARFVAPPPAPPSTRPTPPASRVAERAAAPVKPSVPRVDPPPRAATPSTVARETSDSRGEPPRTAVPAAPLSPVAPVVAPPPPTPASDRAAPPAVETPKLQVQVVVYSDVPAQRMVFIDGRRYAEGDKVDAETVIERITPEGAIVTRRGQRHTLTSGRRP
jgi:hypothetical protein